MSRELLLRWPIPDTVDLDKELEQEIVNLTKEEVVLRLFKERKISSGYAADLLGWCLADFMDFLKQKGIPFAHYTEEDLKMDLEAIEQYKKEISQERKKT